MRIKLAMALVLAHVVSPAASAADPYREPAVQSQREFATAYASLAGMKVNVARAYASSSRFPPTYVDAGVDGPVMGPYFAIELGPEGVLKIMFNANADPALAGTELTAVPTINESGDVIWHCLAPDIPKDVRPRACR